MAKSKSQFICQECGGAHPKWSGKCEHCGSWNCLVEEIQERAPGPAGRAQGRKVALESLKSDAKPLPRISTGIPEFDRVLGGGLVPGSATLIGGDPGIGKVDIITADCLHNGSTGSESCVFFRRRICRSDRDACRTPRAGRAKQ